MFYGSGIEFMCCMGCISSLRPPTQTVDIKESWGDVRFSVTQTNRVPIIPFWLTRRAVPDHHRSMLIFSFRKVKYFICLCSFLMRRLRFSVKFGGEMNEGYFVWQTFLKKKIKTTKWKNTEEQGRNEMLDHCRVAAEFRIRTNIWNEVFLKVEHD